MFITFIVFPVLKFPFGSFSLTLSISLLKLCIFFFFAKIHIIFLCFKHLLNYSPTHFWDGSFNSVSGDSNIRYLVVGLHGLSFPH